MGSKLGIKEMTNEALNGAIATEIMGWIWEDNGRGHLSYWVDQDDKLIINYYGETEFIPSTSISDAFRIVNEKAEGNVTLRRFWKDLSIDDPVEMVWDCDLRIGDNFAHVTKCLTPERAICEAAVLAARMEHDI